MIRMGVHPSLIPILIDFLSDRKMSVKMNGEESSLHTLVAGGPQGSINGQICASNDCADCVDPDDIFRYCDDLQILELITLSDILIEYDFRQHVASDVGVNQLFLPPEKCRTQGNLDLIAGWTDDNLMQLNEAKSNFLIFTRARNDFASRFVINNKNIDRKYVTKLLGVFLEEGGGWSENTKQICKRSYSKIVVLSKLKYAGVSIEDLLDIYILFIRSCTEYCSVAFHSSLTALQSKAIENIQSTSLKIILQDNYISYSAALEMTGLPTLAERREKRCLAFSLKCLKYPINSKLFPVNKNILNNPIQ